jgi:hypothetical protein
LYSYVDNDVNERIGQSEVLFQFTFLLPPFFLGYSIIFLLDYYKWVSKSKKIYFNFYNFGDLDIINSLFLVLVIFSKFVLTVTDGSLGAFTIFVVFTRMTFPLIILVFYSFRSNKQLSVLNLYLLCFFIIIDLFYSSWRSELIFVFISITISIIFKYNFNRKQIYQFLIISLLTIIFSMPFQILKKNSEEMGLKNISFLNGTILDQLVTGFKIIPHFIVNRLNYLREMSYVNSAILYNKINYIDGESYSSIFYQLIPRTIWKDKPLFNEFYGRRVPRLVGLVGESDQGTSWAVNPFAEFLYNFNYSGLWIFIILLFTLLRKIDLLTDSLNIDSRLKLYLELSLFFLSLNLVSLIFSSTYLIWLFIFILIINKFIINKNKTFNLNNL